MNLLIITLNCPSLAKVSTSKSSVNEQGFARLFHRNYAFLIRSLKGGYNGHCDFMTSNTYTIAGGSHGQIL
jgi:hypothetical protein